MKRILSIALVLAVLAPLAPLIASLCSDMPCCAGGPERVSAPMGCCPPAMCVTAAPEGRQQKAADSAAPPIIAAVPEPTEEAPASIEPQHPSIEPASTPPMRVRLALIATLLI